MSVAIAPDDANIVYSPFNWSINSSRALTINPGAYFSFCFAGSLTSLNFTGIASLTLPRPRLLVRVDGDFVGASTNEVAIDTVVGVAIPSSNTWTKHYVEVFVMSTTGAAANRWAPVVTAVQFTGITLGNGSSLVPITPRALNVLCYGDSITEGVRSRNLSATNDTQRNDATLTWALGMRDALGAEIGLVGFGGTGLSAGGGSSSAQVPNLPGSYSLLYDGSAARSFSAPVPDAICILMGENDGATDITAAYTALLNTMLAATPLSTKILAFRTFNGNRAANAAAAVAACTDRTRVTYVDTTGWFDPADSADGTHPYGYTALVRLAPLAADAVRDALDNGPLYYNDGTGAVTLTPYRG